MSNILLNAIDKAIGSSSEAGTIHIRRLGLKQYGIKRFSSNGDVITSDDIKDEPLATEDIVDTLPDNSDVAVFSDETTGTEDIVMTIDGGDLDEEIAEACDSGYKEETKKFSKLDVEKPGWYVLRELYGEPGESIDYYIEQGPFSQRIDAQDAQKKIQSSDERHNFTVAFVNKNGEVDTKKFSADSNSGDFDVNSITKGSLLRHLETKLKTVKDPNLKNQFEDMIDELKEATESQFQTALKNPGFKKTLETFGVKKFAEGDTDKVWLWKVYSKNYYYPLDVATTHKTDKKSLLYFLNSNSTILTGKSCVIDKVELVGGPLPLSDCPEGTYVIEDNISGY